VPATVWSFGANPKRVRPGTDEQPRSPGRHRGDRSHHAGSRAYGV